MWRQYECLATIHKVFTTYMLGRNYLENINVTLELWHTFAFCTFENSLSCCCCTCFWTHSVVVIEFYYEKVKREIVSCSVRRFIQNRGKLMSAKHKLHTFQVKTTTVRDKDLLGNRCHNFRYLQHPCSSPGNCSGRYCSKLSFLLFFQHSWNTYCCPILSF